MRRPEKKPLKGTYGYKYAGMGPSRPDMAQQAAIVRKKTACFAASLCPRATARGEWSLPYRAKDPKCPEQVSDQADAEVQA